MAEDQGAAASDLTGCAAARVDANEGGGKAMAEDQGGAPEKRARKCPICGKPVETAFRPFCSARCRDVDLAHWLGGTYAISGGSADADEDGDSAAVAGLTGAPGAGNHGPAGGDSGGDGGDGGGCGGN